MKIKLPDHKIYDNGPEHLIGIKEKDDNRCSVKQRVLMTFCVFISLLGTVLGLLSLYNVLVLLQPNLTTSLGTTTCPTTTTTSSCSVSLVESIPEGLVYNNSVVANQTISTYSAWSQLISLAENEIHQAGMYWTLRGQDLYPHPSDWQGEDIFNQLVNAATKRNVKLKIVQNKPRPNQPNLDTEELAKSAGAEVRNLDFTHLMGAGILHTKLWVVDNKHFYVGSANFDWRSLTQVKELGVLVTDCPCLANDMDKIWSVYNVLANKDKIPDTWPDSLSTNINSNSPLKLSNDLSVFLSSSPAPFCPSGRDVDLDSIIKIIDSADKFVHISVMDYFPSTIYTRHPQFWPDIDNALRRAAINRGVSVRLLMSKWDHTRPSMIRYLKSLTSLSGTSSPKVDIQARTFTVPSFTPDQAQIPFARVNHNKYMVTDKTGYIGTSNWSGDYFISTAGVGFVFQGSDRQILVDIFNRDWNSDYAHQLV